MINVASVRKEVTSEELEEFEMSSLTATSLIEKYGHLLTQDQLADVLKRKVGGLRWSLAQEHPDPALAHLKKVERAIGRRKYYPAIEVAHVIDGTFDPKP